MNYAKTDIIFVLQIVVSTIYLANKGYVLIGKKMGWIVGVIAAMLAIIYYSMLGRYVYVVLNVGLAILMTYGYWKKGAPKPKVEMFIHISTGVFVLAMAYFSMQKTLNDVELGSSIGLILGTYFLTHKRKGLGWTFYAVAHALAAWLGYCAIHQYYFADLQVASTLIAVIGIQKENSPPPPGECL